MVIDYVCIIDEIGTHVGSTTDLMPIIIKPAETEIIRIFISDFNGIKDSPVFNPPMGES